MFKYLACNTAPFIRTMRVLLSIMSSIVSMGGPVELVMLNMADSVAFTEMENLRSSTNELV